MRRLAPFTALAALLPLVLGVSSAAAEGGSSISSATPIALGVQEFGNTGNGPKVENRYRSFWSLNVTADDHLLIDWEAAGNVQLQLFPSGTSDFNLEHTEPMRRQYPSGNGKNELRLTVPQTGSIPVLFSSSQASTYAFTVFIQHSLSLQLPRLSGLRHRGTLKVEVHNPEGGIISDPSLRVELQVKRGSSWVAIGSAPVSESIAAVAYKTPRRLRGHKVSLRAVANGPSYFSEKSESLRVRVKR